MPLKPDTIKYLVDARDIFNEIVNIAPTANLKDEDARHELLYLWKKGIEGIRLALLRENITFTDANALNNLLNFRNKLVEINPEKKLNTEFLNVSIDSYKIANYLQTLITANDPAQIIVPFHTENPYFSTILNFQNMLVANKSRNLQTAGDYLILIKDLMKQINIILGADNIAQLPTRRFRAIQNLFEVIGHAVKDMIWTKKINSNNKKQEHAIKSELESIAIKGFANAYEFLREMQELRGQYLHQMKEIPANIIANYLPAFTIFDAAIDQKFLSTPQAKTLASSYTLPLSAQQQTPQSTPYTFTPYSQHQHHSKVQTTITPPYSNNPYGRTVLYNIPLPNSRPIPNQHTYHPHLIQYPQHFQVQPVRPMNPQVQPARPIPHVQPIQQVQMPGQAQNTNPPTPQSNTGRPPPKI